MANTDLWPEGLAESCNHFQFDLSCLVDGELDEGAASRAVAHIETCSGCREFFEDVRLQVHLHLDMSDPSRLLERFGALVGREIEGTELVRKLASVFYQIGKAYLLLAIDPGWRTRVFEPAVRIEIEQTRGRGFVDGVVASGRADASGVDWTHARHMLNGQLAKIEGSLDKGKRLLHEALRVLPGHEESRIYLAFAASHEGRKMKAAEEFRRIFRTAMSEINRGHAAVQLGLIYGGEGEYRRALACFRWVTMSGLADVDERFFFARFDIGMYYAYLQEPTRSLATFRELIDRHPDRVAEIARFFDRSPRLRACIDSQQGFPESLRRECPELFESTHADSEPREESE